MVICMFQCFSFYCSHALFAPVLPYVKLIASGNLLYDAESPNVVLCDYLEGRDGVRSGRESQDEGDICMPLADSC